MLSVLVLTFVVSSVSPAAPWSIAVAVAQTPAVEQSTVITASDEPIEATPSGDQTLSLAAVQGAPATLDPAFAWDIGTTFIVRQIFRGLTRLDEQLRPVPELAGRIEISADGLTYTFHLREDARFQNGRRITADDVIYSLTRAIDPQTAGGDASQLSGQAFLSDIEGASELISGQTVEVSGLRAVDESTVEIRLVSPRSTFLMKLAAAPASIIDPRQVQSSTDWSRSPNGSGPFRVAEWSQGDRLRLEASDHYYAGEPSLTSIEFKLGPSALQPLNLYQADEIDVATVDITGIDQVLAPEHDLSDELVVTPMYALEFVAFRTDVAPMDDPHIRRAVQLGFDEDKVAEVTFNAHVEPACGLIPMAMPGGYSGCADVPFDPEAAKHEIKLSRFGSAEKVPSIQIYIGVSGAGRTMVDVFAESLRQTIGLQVDVIALDLPDFLGGLSAEEYPAYELYWSADFPDAESLLWTLFSSESKDNYTDYQNQSFDDALGRAASERDPVKRANFYAEAQQILMNDAVVLPLYYDVAYTVVKPYVKGLYVTPIGILGLERVWLER